MHCMGGHGRTGLVVIPLVATLFSVGVESSRAFVAGSTAVNRPSDAASSFESHMPETEEQCAVAGEVTRLLARRTSLRR